MSAPAPLTAETLKAATAEHPQWYGLDPELGPCWVGTDGYACRFGYRRGDYRIRGLVGKQRRLSMHILAWLLDHLGPMERDALYLAYLEFRSSGLQGSSVPRASMPKAEPPQSVHAEREHPRRA